MVKAFLFDLDSTLLQMNQEEFLMCYFKSVAQYAAKLGYDAKEFMNDFNIAAYAIIKNDGTMTNEERFWTVLGKKYKEIDFLKDAFNRFYSNEFKELESVVHKTSTPKAIVDYLKSKGYTILLATNPVFPRISTYTRLSWSGCRVEDFSDITTYEESTYCKPNHSYYFELLNRNNLKPEECVMVGNDIDDDFSDIPSDITCYMITDYLINKENKKIDIPCFSMDEFFEFVKKTY